MSRLAFAIIWEARRVGDTEVQGRTYSRHRSARTAWSAADKCQRSCKRANGKSTYLPLTIIQVTWSGGNESRGILADDPRHHS